MAESRANAPYNERHEAGLSGRERTGAPGKHGRGVVCLPRGKLRHADAATERPLQVARGCGTLR
ncbi:hypothetical protein GCM10020370_13690 [Paenibacillus hodogayensis]